AEIGQDVYSSYREYIRLHENTSCQGKPRHPKRAKWRVIAMAKINVVVQKYGRELRLSPLE
ncbi:hypothetical protein LNL97_29845, partial [Escherichia coli]|nr:hypothetical protein [Escherichia coli]